MTGINVPLLRKALEHISEHPEEWRQSDWAIKCDEPVELSNINGESEMFCGTAFCLAGHVTVMAGHQIRWVSSPGLSGTATAGRTTNLVHISDVARDELGLTEEQAGDLFAASNTLRYLWARASLYTNGEIEVPEEFR